jgi:hypothetical protein
MELQRLSVKLLAQETNINPTEFVPVFHSWIRKKTLEDHLMIDVADYNHVPEGPGTLLVTHEGNFSTALADGKLALLYQRKRFTEGTLSARLNTALKAVLNASEFLEQEPEFKSRLSFERKRFWVISNDRLNLPNTDQSFELLRPALAKIAEEYFGHDHFSLSHQGGRKEPLCILVESAVLN